jgi:hypothetical protein
MHKTQERFITLYMRPYDNGEIIAVGYSGNSNKITAYGSNKKVLNNLPDLYQGFKVVGVYDKKMAAAHKKLHSK